MYLELIKEKMVNCFDFFVLGLKKINIDRINSACFDTIKFVCYNSKVSLHEVAFVKTIDFRTLLITPHDTTQIKELYKSFLAINDFHLIYSLCDGKTIKAVLPPLTEQTRLAFIKKVKDAEENTKIKIRNIRREGNLKIKNLVKDKKISSTEEKFLQNEIQMLTDVYIKKITLESSGKVEKLSVL